MKKFRIILIIILFISFGIDSTGFAVSHQRVKVLNIESSEVIKEVDHSSKLDQLAITAIKGIENITVQANPLPKEGYLIKIPLTSSIKVKNKWFHDLVTEILLVYDPTTKGKGKLILYNDENSPIFFDISYNFSDLFNQLELKE